MKRFIDVLVTVQSVNTSQLNGNALSKSKQSKSKQYCNIDNLIVVISSTCVLIHACIFCAVPHSEAWAEQKTLKDNLCSKLLFKKSPKYFFDSECAVYYLTKTSDFCNTDLSSLDPSCWNPYSQGLWDDGGTRSSSTKGTTVYTCSSTNPQFWKQKNPGNELFSETSHDLRLTYILRLDQ